MQYLRSACAAVVLIALAVPVLHAQTPNAAPVDPDATPEARALLHEIDSISGRGTLSGQHNFPNTVSRYSDRILELTGSYPAIFGQDFGFSAGEDKDSTLGRPSMIAEVIRQYHRGAVIALTWHAVRPTEDEPVTFRDSVQGHLSDWEWQQLLTPGTDLHARWEKQTDRIAGYLKELQDAGVPVLFRPYHEMNGNWFWWGGRPGPQGSQELYRQLFNRYVRVHQLHNLVWIWNVNAPSGNAGPVDQYFPGTAFADVLTMDIYGPFEQAYYDSMIALAGPQKPIALAEVGAMPTLAVLAQQPRWAYFMMWSGLAEGANSPEQLKAMFHAPNVINRGDPRLTAPIAQSAQAHPSPVDPEATKGARDLLSTLSAVRFDPNASSNVSSSAPASGPANPIFTEFQLEGRSADAVRAELKQSRESGKVPLLRWTPPSPAASGQRPLDDFEWGELLEPGTALHTAWVKEVDQLVAQIKELQDKDSAVVLNPLPQPNSPAYWWSQRPGPEGSQRLIEDLYAALQNAGVHTVLLAWQPALVPPTAGQARPTPLSSFSPGPGLFDLLLVDGAAGSLRGFGGRILLEAAGPKPVVFMAAGP
jgi:mannan endo-1,4-beta-mannosidase